jgi:DNA-binding NtrC family response regulator
MMPFHDTSAFNPPPSSPPRQKILLVDEDAKDLRYFTSLLDGMGCSVEAFTDHRKAEAYLEHGNFDLVILSQSTAVLDTQCLRRFTIGRNRYTPVVVLTRWPEIESYVEAMQLGVTDYIEKPLSPAEIERLVITYCKPQQCEVSASRS